MQSCSKATFTRVCARVLFQNHLQPALAGQRFTDKRRNKKKSETSPKTCSGIADAYGRWLLIEAKLRDKSQTLALAVFSSDVFFVAPMCPILCLRHGHGQSSQLLRILVERVYLWHSKPLRQPWNSKYLQGKIFCSWIQTNLFIFCNTWIQPY